MKKFCFFLVLIYASATGVYAQNDYYWYKGQKILLEKIPDKKYLLVENVKDANGLKQKLNLPNAKVHRFENTNVYSGINAHKGKPQIEKTWAVVENENLKNLKISNKDEVIYEGSFYHTSEKKEIGLTHMFYVKLKNEGDVAKLEAFALTNQVEIMGSNKFMPLWFTVACTKKSKGNALEMANLFQESGLFASSEPNFVIENLLQCNNDPLFGNQWGLKHTGQNGWSPSGTDIKACAAWQTTTGSNNIVVAVFDEGLELNHPDMTNLHPYSFDSYTASSPSVVRGNHGTACAGIIGANANNSLGISGIAPQSPLMSISIKFGGNATLYTDLANGMNWAWQNGASVISNSWGGGSGSSLLDNAITNALTLGRNGLGCVVIFATGNDNSSVSNPANSNADIIAVGAMSPCAQRKSPTSCDAESFWGSNYGATLDIVAPGVKIPTTDRQGSSGYNTASGLSGDYFQTFNGTSSATPHVAAVAALILSVNHNLTQKQVSDIIESTAQKVGSYSYNTTGGRPNGTWHNEMGYGLINAEAAVLSAQSMCAASKELYSKDWHDDFGIEPNGYTGASYSPSYTPTAIWISEDIWVRNQPDGMTNQVHQNPEFSITNNPAQLNYIYVRVRNRGCQVSSGTETVSVHWAKANTYLTWPASWNGNSYLDAPNNTALAGALIGTANVTAIIQPGGSTIVEIPVAWNPPNPDIYAAINNDDPWHFCLLSRIIDATDPITTQNDIGSYVLDNNKVAWKNMSVVNLVPLMPGEPCPDELMEYIGTAVAVGNPENISATYNLAFSVPKEETGTPLTGEGQVYVSLDNKLYDNWVKGGRKGTGFKEVLVPPMSELGKENNNINDHSPVVAMDRKLFTVTGTSTRFDNITFDPGEYRTVTMMTLYPSNPVSEKQDFNYDVIQTKTDDQKVTGGVRYVVKKPKCSDLTVDAGSDRAINRGCSTTLSASPLLDCTAYWWLDEAGKIISQNSSVLVSPAKTTNYTLKAVASAGCITEDKVTVQVTNQMCPRIKEREIIKVNPNPADDKITVEYRVENTKSAQLRLVKSDNTVDRTYQLNMSTNLLTLDVSDLIMGSYTIALICDGIKEDSKTIIIK